MIKLSKRLKTIADFIEPKDYILDVGCDHALLSIYVLLNKIDVRVMASDINAKPLKKAKENKTKYNAKSLIIKQGNGLEVINNEINTIVLAGLGAKTILDILFKDKNKLDNIKKIIISSNNDLYKIRKTMMLKKYKISEEKIIHEKGKYYIILVFKKGITKYNHQELKYGPLLLKEKNIIYKKYIQNQIIKNQEIEKRLPKKYIIKRIFVKKETKFLKKI